MNLSMTDTDGSLVVRQGTLPLRVQDHLEAREVRDRVYASRNLRPFA